MGCNFANYRENISAYLNIGYHCINLQKSVIFWYFLNATAVFMANKAMEEAHFTSFKLYYHTYQKRQEEDR